MQLILQIQEYFFPSLLCVTQDFFVLFYWEISIVSAWEQDLTVMYVIFATAPWHTDPPLLFLFSSLLLFHKNSCIAVTTLVYHSWFLADKRCYSILRWQSEITREGTISTPLNKLGFLFANTEQAQKQGGRGEEAFPSLYVYAAKEKVH